MPVGDCRGGGQGNNHGRGFSHPDLHGHSDRIVFLGVGGCENQILHAVSRVGGDAWIFEREGARDGGLSSHAQVIRRECLAVGDQGGEGFVQNGWYSLFDREVDHLGGSEGRIGAGGGDAVVAGIGGCGGAGGIGGAVAPRVAQGKNKTGG